MIQLFFCLFLLFSAQANVSSVARALTVSDSINPGTGEYIIRGIQDAEKENAPYVVIEIDTPGGLLQTTRLIVQQMLNAKIPVVVFVSPRGAHAGSAGALITFAADVAVMAPSTNIGAAHPVGMGSDKMDKTMSDKVTNDVAAFAEGLAKARGRNTEWAISAVRKSVSITADKALEEGVIDLIANDLTDLSKKLAGYQLKAPKYSVLRLPVTPTEIVPVKMPVKDRLVSFFADPNLAYLIMSLGGLCLWIELSHPGLIFPGVLGLVCIILSLVSFQALPIHSGALALILMGMGLIISELFFTSYGILGVGGVACFVLGSLFLMDTNVPEFQLSLNLIIPTALVLVGFAFLLGLAVFRARKKRDLSGLGALVGEKGIAREPIRAHSGKVLIHGELWNATSKNGQEISVNTTVQVTEIRNMLLVVTREGE